MAFGTYEDEMDVKRKLAQGYRWNGKGFLVPPEPEVPRGIPRSVAKGKKRVLRGEAIPSQPQREIASRTRLDIPRTSDPDYFAESLLDEIRSCHNSVIDCYRDLKKQLTVIEKNLMAIKRSVRKK